MDDLISRQAAIKLAMDLDYESRGILKESKCREIESRYNMIPSAQPEPSIPISWIKEQINWLKGVDNGFAKLSAMNTEVLLKKWMKGEEDGRFN